jgi:hypothetical protein
MIVNPTVTKVCLGEEPPLGGLSRGVKGDPLQVAGQVHAEQEQADGLDEAPLQTQTAT